MISKRSMGFGFHEVDVAMMNRCPLEWIGQSNSLLDRARGIRAWQIKNHAQR